MDMYYLTLLCWLFIVPLDDVTSKECGDRGEISTMEYGNIRTETDTLRVSQHDTTIFRRVERIIARPCSKPELVENYELIAPKDGVYYLINNDKQQLVLEGKFSASFTYEGVTYKEGNFYNSKRYTYKKNGDLKAIYIQEEGRNKTAEFYDSKKQLTSRRYFNKKSGDTEKIELYKKGRLKETRVYSGFNTYKTIKAD
ncbi:hypothetical protein [Sphingobacterium detergens]|nr:hypothetical protein [Sphingobacterium detergens]